ncbi:MAG: hydantoinase B/oxoprolinase family protein [Comamonadaceae bacterium]|nr:hydantoinase B/oxoprolinase family protein [Comamonadaceae bacterium]
MQTHMTNSRLTDPEVLEFRFPVRLESYEIRAGSGGAGRWRGGDGGVRRVRFLEPMTAVDPQPTAASCRPFGMAGGAAGRAGRQPRRARRRPASRRWATSARSRCGRAMSSSIETPGGGGYGAAPPALAPARRLRDGRRAMNPCRPVILVAGFEPFGGEAVNPSRRGRARHCRRSAVEHARVESLRAALRASARRSRRSTPRWRGTHPALVLAARPGLPGAATSRSSASRSTSTTRASPTTLGAQPVDEPVVPGGPAALLHRRCRSRRSSPRCTTPGCRLRSSQTAGTFVCNHVFYGLMHRLAPRPGVRGGFVHLPLLPEQAARRPGAPSLPLATQVDGVRVVVQTAWATRQDLKVAGGAVD